MLLHIDKPSEAIKEEIKKEREKKWYMGTMLEHWYYLQFLGHYNCVKIGKSEYSTLYEIL